MKTVPACSSVFKLLTLVNSVIMVSSFGLLRAATTSGRRVAPDYGHSV